jgi:uncharacterized OB-fold protein
MSEAELRGIVQSHTVIRVPGQQLAAEGPFVLLLVELDDGQRVLGRFNGPEPPPINSRVMAQAKENATPSFRIAEETP